MSYKERYRIERKDEIERAERRLNRLCKILTIVIISTMFISLFCMAALDDNPSVTLMIACISLTVMITCLLCGERMACNADSTLD